MPLNGDLDPDVRRQIAELRERMTDDQLALLVLKRKEDKPVAVRVDNASSPVHNPVHAEAQPRASARGSTVMPRPPTSQSGGDVEMRETARPRVRCTHRPQVWSLALTTRARPAESATAAVAAAAATAASRRLDTAGGCEGLLRCGGDVGGRRRTPRRRPEDRATSSCAPTQARATAHRGRSATPERADWLGRPPSDFICRQGLGRDDGRRRDVGRGRDDGRGPGAGALGKEWMGGRGRRTRKRAPRGFCS